MKLFSILFGMIFANPMMHLLLHKALDDENSDSNDNLLMMMVMSPGLLGGNQDQAHQMDAFRMKLCFLNTILAPKTQGVGGKQTMK